MINKNSTIGMQKASRINAEKGLLSVLYIRHMFACERACVYNEHVSIDLKSASIQQTGGGRGGGFIAGACTCVSELAHKINDATEFISMYIVHMPSTHKTRAHSHRYAFVWIFVGFFTNCSGKINKMVFISALHGAMYESNIGTRLKSSCSQ